MHRKTITKTPRHRLRYHFFHLLHYLNTGWTWCAVSGIRFVSSHPGDFWVFSLAVGKCEPFERSSVITTNNFPFPASWHGYFKQSRLLQHWNCNATRKGNTAFLKRVRTGCELPPVIRVRLSNRQNVGTAISDKNRMQFAKKIMPANVFLGVCFSVGQSRFNKNYKPLALNWVKVKCEVIFQ